MKLWCLCLWCLCLWCLCLWCLWWRASLCLRCLWSRFYVVLPLARNLRDTYAGAADPCTPANAVLRNADPTHCYHPCHPNAKLALDASAQRGRASGDADGRAQAARLLCAWHGPRLPNVLGLCPGQLEAHVRSAAVPSAPRFVEANERARNAAQHQSSLGRVRRHRIESIGPCFKNGQPPSIHVGASQLCASSL